MSKKLNSIIIIIVLIILGYFGYQFFWEVDSESPVVDEALVEELNPFKEASEPANPFAETNNPYENIKTNPFE